MAAPHILVAEPDRLLRWSLKECLRDGGFEACECASVQECLDRFQGTLDLLLLGLGLRHSEDFLLLDGVGRAYPRSPLIVMSPCTWSEAVAAAKAHGALFCLGKPFKLEDVLRVVRAALRGKDEMRSGGEPPSPSPWSVLAV